MKAFTTDAPLRVIAYVRVSTEDQADSRVGLDAQRAAILAASEQQGWHLIEVIEDAGYSAKDLKRPGVQAALAALDHGEADALVVSKLDRLSRSMLDFTSIMEIAQKRSWGLIALDVNVDTTTPAGEMIANVMATFAQFERRLIGERTRSALQEKKRQGVKLGRRRVLDPKVANRIAQQRERGLTLAAIAEELNVEGVPTAQGGARWYPSTIKAVLAYAGGDK